MKREIKKSETKKSKIKKSKIKKSKIKKKRLRMGAGVWAAVLAAGSLTLHAAGVTPRPQDDFYGYVNKEYLDSLTVSYADSEGVGGIADMTLATDEELRQLIQRVAASEEWYEPGSSEQLVRDAYRQIAAYLKTGEGSGKKHFEELAGRIRSAGDMGELRDLIRALIEEEGITAYFDIKVEQNYYDGRFYALSILQKQSFAGFEMKDIYTKDDVRRQLRRYVCNVLAAAGEEADGVKEKADELVYFVTDVACHTDHSLAKMANPFLALDFHGEEETDALLANLTSRDLYRMYDLENPYGGWMIEDEEQTAFLSKCFVPENLEVLKTWLVCEVLYMWQDYLTADYVFLGGFAQGKSETAERQAVSLTIDLMARQVSELYAAAYYTEEMDRQLRQIYEDVTASYRELIQKADWLTKSTRDRLIRKLDNMQFVCGAGKPRKTDQRDAELIGADAFDTMCRIRLRKVEENRKKAGTTVDREETAIGSFVVNAAYNPNNSFVVCVGIMKAPYFDVHADYAENLGGLGIVVGHEIGHAFDSICIDYDENGIYDPAGIEKEDREKLAERLKQMEDYYSSYSIMDIYYVDGKRTSSENYADKGAMECLMNIVKTPQEREKVFRGYARAFALLTEDDYAIGALDADEHSPAEVRVNAVLSSTGEFYECYDVKPGDGMYVPPERRVSRYH